MNAGDGTVIAGGVAYSVTENVDLSLSVGYEKSKTNGSNGDLIFSRRPIELLLFRNIGKNWRLGGGLRNVNNAQLETSGVVAGNDQSYKSSSGGVLEAQYLTDRGGNPYGRFGVSVRYVADRYDGNAVTSQPGNFNLASPPFSGNHVDLSLMYMY